MTKPRSPKPHRSLPQRPVAPAQSVQSFPKQRGTSRSDAGRALRLTVVFLLVGLTWIYFSDLALERMTDSPELMRQLQTWKGAAFVVVTGVLVFILSWRALARQSRLIDRLEYRVTHNPLTGLPSRGEATLRIERATRRGRVAVVAFDIDHFGSINDSFGHSVGDELLRAVGERLTGELADTEFLAHPSADEFILVVEGLHDGVAVQARVKRLREQLARPFALRGVHSVFVSACIGAAVYPDHARSSAGLVQCAEAALARAKQTGPDRFCAFDQAMLQRTRRHIELDAGLRHALARGELELYYQPVVLSGDLSVVGFEALMRWQPADGPPVPPTQFIPVAERSGLIMALGDWAVEEACRQLAAWRETGADSIDVSVNLSARQVAAGTLPQLVGKAMADNSLEPGQLVLEITESLLMEQGRDALEQLERLHGLGVKLALDDFGTGFSSLAYLRSLPVDVLKIDRSFIEELDRADTDRQLIEAIVSMARIFGLTVIAEGVETEMQMAILRQLGCDRLQGFRLGRPMPGADVPDWLAGQARYNDQ